MHLILPQYGLIIFIFVSNSWTAITLRICSSLLIKLWFITSGKNCVLDISLAIFHNVLYLFYEWSVWFTKLFLISSIKAILLVNLVVSYLACLGGIYTSSFFLCFYKFIEKINVLMVNTLIIAPDFFILISVKSLWRIRERCLTSHWFECSTMWRARVPKRSTVNLLEKLGEYMGEHLPSYKLPRKTLSN